MIGVLIKYYVKQVMRFNHKDFLRALKIDLGPILGDVGLWALNNYKQAQA